MISATLVSSLLGREFISKGNSKLAQALANSRVSREEKQLQTIITKLIIISDFMKDTTFPSQNTNLPYLDYR